MDNMYYDENDIRKSIEKLRACIIAFFGLLLFLYIVVVALMFKPKNVEYGEVKIAFAPYSITSMLGGLDSLAQHDVNDDMALLLMREIEVQHPHIVLAQMKLESGHYQSKLAKENNNYFGMKHPRQRLTMSMGEKNGYAHFRSWAYSILDYALWQKRYAYDLDEQEYLQKIGSVYAEDEEYIRKVKNLTKK
jgi:hypothetical protein